MVITIKALLTAPLLDSTFAAVDIADVRGNVYDGLTLVGYSDTVTLVNRVITFSPTGTYSITKLYQVELSKTTGGEVLTGRDPVWIKTASGEFLAGDLNEIAMFERYITGFPPVVRDIRDTNEIEFEWPYSGATFVNSASTCERRFSGETGAQSEALGGAITALSGVSGKYVLAYAIADRAADGAAVVPTEVTYSLFDDAGNFGDLVLRIVPVGSGTTGGTTLDRSPVAPTGRLRQIIIGDDYLAANLRSFVWTVPEVEGFVASAVVAKFGAKASLPCGEYSFLVEGEATDNNDGTWEVSVDLPRAATYGLIIPGSYDWSMVLEHNDVVITKVQNLTDQDKVKVIDSPV